jgi:hypothetical protein
MSAKPDNSAAARVRAAVEQQQAAEHWANRGHLAYAASQRRSVQVGQRASFIGGGGSPCVGEPTGSSPSGRGTQ